MIEGLTFDEETHTYRFEGVVVPSVTQILKPLSNFDAVPREVLSAASSFGTAVHKACELQDFGQLDISTVDDALLPYLEAWMRFCRDYKCMWEMVEGIVYNPSLRYAGTLDRFGIVAGRSTVVDIKSSAELYPSVGPQLAAYKNALPKSNPTCIRMAVQLKGNGNYVAKTYTNKADWPMFAALVTVRNWCAEHNVTPNY